MAFLWQSFGMLQRLLLCSLVCSSLIACRGGRLGANRGRQEIGKINDDIVFADEVKRELLPVRINASGPIPEEELRRAFDALVDRKLLLQEAQRRHIVVASDQVEKNYTRIKDEFPANEFDKMLEEQQITPAIYKELTRDQLVIAKLFRFEVHSRVVITDQEVQDYGKAHPELMRQEEKVRCAQIVQRNSEEMQSVLDKVQKGMPFEEAASRFSIAPEAKQGGDLGWFGRGVMPTVIEEGCFNTEPGKVSKPVEAEQQDDDSEDKALKLVHVFKVIAKKPAEEVPLEKMRDQLESRLRREREERAETELLEQLHKKATIKIDDKRLAALGI